MPTFRQQKKKSGAQLANLTKSKKVSTHKPKKPKTKNQKPKSENQNPKTKNQKLT